MTTTTIAKKHSKSISQLFNSFLVAEAAMRRNAECGDQDTYAYWKTQRNEVAKKLKELYDINTII